MIARNSKIFELCDGIETNACVEIVRRNAWDRFRCGS